MVVATASCRASASSPSRLRHQYLGAEGAQPGADHRPEGVADAALVGHAAVQQFIAQDEDFGARAPVDGQLVVAGGSGEAEHSRGDRQCPRAAVGRRSGTPGRADGCPHRARGRRCVSRRRPLISPYSQRSTAVAPGGMRAPVAIRTAWPSGSVRGLRRSPARIPLAAGLLGQLPGAGPRDGPAVHRRGVEGGQIGERVERGAASVWPSAWSSGRPSDGKGAPRRGRRTYGPQASEVVSVSRRRVRRRLSCRSGRSSGKGAVRRHRARGSRCPSRTWRLPPAAALAGRGTSGLAPAGTGTPPSPAVRAKAEPLARAIASSSSSAPLIGPPSCPPPASGPSLPSSDCSASSAQRAASAAALSGRFRHGLRRPPPHGRRVAHEEGGERRRGPGHAVGGVAGEVQDAAVSTSSSMPEFGLDCGDPFVQHGAHAP